MGEESKLRRPPPPSNYVSNARMRKSRETLAPSAQDRSAVERCGDGILENFVFLLLG